MINFEDFPLERKVRGKSWFELDLPTQLEQRKCGIVAPDYPNPVAKDWPDLLAIVESRVRPGRLTDNRENYRRFWWQYGERRPGLVKALRDRSETFVLCRVSPHLSIVRVSSKIVGADSLDYITLDSSCAFAILQSRPHEIWARFMASSLEDRLRYTPSDCFETFPFPLDYEKNTKLEEAGRAYYEFRAELMVSNNEGLTKTYNRFHNPNEKSRDIQQLRKLHDNMDRAVLDAYGWRKLRPTCEFFPEFENDENEDESESKRIRVKKYRYRWPDDIHDELLAMLLTLNQERAAAPHIDTAEQRFQLT
ncbi:MAG: type IIL restriction-modification enzyme MmeI [Bryobacteraceae bacterium]